MTIRGDKPAAAPLLRPEELPDPEAARLRKGSVVVAGHATSVSLEEAFWAVLREEAARRGASLNALVTEIDAQRSGNLSAALRVFCLQALDRQRRGDRQRRADSPR